MILTYLFLGLSVISSIFSGSIILISILAILSMISAFISEIITAFGITSLICFGYLCNHFYSSKLYNSKRNRKTELLYLLGILFCTFLFSFHYMPGFANYLVDKAIKLSHGSCQFSLYLNFDKTIVALILFIFSGLYKKEKPITYHSIGTSILYLFLCIIFVLVPAYIFKYVELDIKFPQIGLVFIINNILFVSFSEEVIFRGIIQNYLKTLKFRFSYADIIIGSLLFGLLHFYGGIFYIILSTIAGIFYGLAYDNTNRLSSSIIVHAGINCLHFFFFSYPCHTSFCS